MEQQSESVELDIEESNDLAFKINVEGASTPAKVRLVCEANDMSYMFKGYGTSEDGIVQFTIPRMTGVLKEGSYVARVEVLIENRYFSPVEFDIKFKKAMKVVAEAVKIVPRIKEPTVSVTVEPIIVAKPKTQVAEATKKPVIVEQPVKPVQRVSSSLKDSYVKKKVSGTSAISDDDIKTIAREFLRNKR
jgi:hypothetical protein